MVVNSSKNHFAWFLSAFSPSISLGVVLIASFWFFSAGMGFISVESLHRFAFNVFFRPENAFFFLLIHTGFGHLIANVVLILLAGFVLEKRVSKIHVIGLFLICGIFSVVLYNFFQLNFFGIGASGGAVGLVTAALIMDPKKALGALFASVVIVVLAASLLPFLHSSFESALDSWKNQSQSELMEALDQNDSAEIEKKVEELNRVEQTIEQRKESVAFEQKVPVANWAHLFGSLLAVGYLGVFLRSDFKSALKENAKLLRADAKIRKK